MKILHIIDSLGLGGAQTVVKGILEYQQDNKNIFLFALRKRDITIEIRHPNIKFFNSNKKYSLKSLFELRDLIRKEKIDVLHCHLFKSQLFGFLLKVIWFPKIRLIQHEHGQIFRNNFYYNKFIKISQKKTNLFIAVSKATKNKLIKNGKVENNKIEVLYNFVDLNKFSNKLSKEQLSEEKEKLGIKKDEFVIGFVGRLVKIKGCEYLIKALPYLGFPYKVLIIGDGFEMKKLKNMVGELGIEDKVIFMGYHNHPEKVYPLFDISVLSSLSEASPMIFYESQAFGVPVVGSNVLAINELIFSNKNGLLFELKNSVDLSNKIKQIYNNKTLRMEISKNGLENAKQFSLDNYIEKLNNLYNGVNYK